jgi:signal transduction histidine kinase
LPEPDKELIKTVLSELIDKVRNLSLNLRPSILDDMGLSAALEWLTDRQRKFSQLAIISNISSNMPRFNDKFEISVFRIAQEAFTNIHKYSHADLVNINCSIEGDYLQLTIEDNGVGFDVGSKLNSAIKGQSLGLLSIQERTFLINGLIEIISTPEEGTLIRLRVPVLDNGLDNNPLESGQFELRGNDASL